MKLFDFYPSFIYPSIHPYNKFAMWGDVGQGYKALVMKTGKFWDLMYIGVARVKILCCAPEIC